LKILYIKFIYPNKGEDMAKDKIIYGGAVDSVPNKLNEFLNKNKITIEKLNISKEREGIGIKFYFNRIICNQCIILFIKVYSELCGLKVEEDLFALSSHKGNEYFPGYIIYSDPINPQLDILVTFTNTTRIKIKKKKRKVYIKYNIYY